MFLQKIQILPAVTELDPNSVKPLIFWKRISQNQDKELHLFFLIEGRTDKETHDLGRELWQMVSSYTNELVINQRGLVNPENVCEAILKLCNDFFTNWAQKSPIDKWSDLSVIISLSTPLAIYFARVGEARIILLRNKQIILADENIAQPGSPKFSPPFSEIAGGPLNMGDRFLVASPEIISSFTFDEISSLAAPAGLAGAYHNLLRSLELLNPPRNSAFILGALIPSERPDLELMTPPLNEKLKEARIGELNFIEFNPLLPAAAPVTSPLIPWRETLGAGGRTIFGFLGLIFKIFGRIFQPLSNKVGSLSLTRKIVLFAGIGLFIIYLGFVGSSLINRPGPEPIKTDYQAAFTQAENLKVEAESALIYQDEEKARKNLNQATAILKEVSSSGDWGIKALKLQKEIDDQLATLDKAQNNQANKVWTVPENKGDLKGISLSSNGNMIAVTAQSVFELKGDGDKFTGSEFEKKISLGQEKIWLLSLTNGFLLVAPKSKAYFTINPQTRAVSDKKDLGQDAKESITAIGSFDSGVYTFDPGENQIKLFSFDNESLNFSRNWLKEDLKDNFKDGPAVSISIDGSVFLINKNGGLLRLSGGKKSSWNAEMPSNPSQGEKLVLTTKAENKYLYLLDPGNKRVIIFDKSSGKLAGQVQNTAFGQAVDLQVNEGKKEIYFATPNALFSTKFEI